MRWLGAVISLAVAAAPGLAETPVQPDPSASPPSGTFNPTQEGPTAPPARPPREELLSARRAISEGRVAEAQESLDRAVKRLRSSSPHGRTRSAEAASRLRAAAQASEARQVLQAGHRKRALKLVDAALSRLNMRPPPAGKAHAHAPPS